MDKSEEMVLTAKDCAELLKVSPDTIYNNAKPKEGASENFRQENRQGVEDNPAGAGEVSGIRVGYLRACGKQCGPPSEEHKLLN